MMRLRDAPIASRIPISRWRATARASSRLATFAHPIIRIRPNAKNSGVNRSMASADSGTVPCLGSRTRLFRGPLDGTFSAARRVSQPTEQLRERLTARQTGRQPPDNLEANGAIASLSLGSAAELVEKGERRPEVRRGHRLESSKAFRRHADHLEPHSVYEHGAVEHAWIARKVLGPGAMAEDDHRTAAGFVVCGCERAPPHRAHAKDLEEVPGDELTFPLGAVDPCR